MATKRNTRETKATVRGDERLARGATPEKPAFTLHRRSRHRWTPRAGETIIIVLFGRVLRNQRPVSLAVGEIKMLRAESQKSGMEEGDGHK